MKLFIPIIGTISAGKSTFLKGFLGIDELETGVNTTTKFVCLIQNSSQTSFYHVILKKQNDDVILTKDGEEIKDLNKIKIKIEELNKKYYNNKANQNELFYMLETPIKNIKNTELLQNCIFMDIPGLNEQDTDYIDNIFSIITLKNILFEIFIFDSLSFESDETLNTIKDLEKKKCLQKEGNLYILNKIDNITPGGEDTIIKKFKYKFYDNFDKNSKNNVFINIYQNHFIPMNSILYNAETKIDNDFLSWLIVELFYYIHNSDNDTSTSSFYEYLEKRLDNILSQNGINENDIENESENITDSEMEKITDGIEELSEILTKTEKNQNFIFGIKIEKPKTQRLIKKLFIVHKKKMIGNCFHSQFYEDLQEILSQLKGTKVDDLSSPPPISLTKKPEKRYKEDDILQEMNDFLKENLKNQFDELNSNLRAINENIFGRKIRISFIGQISVGKSTVLNCIIGEKILPTDMTECTYRGIIIKHEPNLNDFYLYKVKSQVINEGGGLLELTNFLEDPKPFCRGVKHIESFLTTKNNDKFIENDSEAFIIIKGKLKIFDYIQLEQELINKIEFVDLPGFDREKNEFNEKKYYRKILKFSSSCIYINIAKNIESKGSFERMKLQYEEDKSNIFPLLQPKFIDTCLFLINKSDELTKKKDREQTKNNLINIIVKMEPLAKQNQNRINISFFSGKYFFEYLENYKRYVTNLENNPILTLNYLYNEWSNSKFSFLFNFKRYVDKYIVKKIEQDYDDINSNPTPGGFYNNLKNAFNQLYSNRYRGISSKEEDEIIKILFNIYELFKKEDFSETKYSNKFFDDLKKVIINAENLQKENFTKNLEAFFQSADLLFKREIKKEIEILKKKGQDNYNLFIKILIPNTEKILLEKENEIKKVINLGKEKCIDKINNEINNVEKYLGYFNYDLEKAYACLEKELSEIINKMKEEQEKITNTIIEDIKKQAEEKIKSYYQSQNLPLDEIQVRIEQTIVLFSEIVALSLTAIAKVLGFSVGVVIGAGILIGACSSLVIGAGVIIGFGLIGGLVLGGIIITVGFLFAKYKKINQYREILEKAKSQLISKFQDIEYSFSEHYKTFKDTLINELKLKTQVYLKRINNDDSEWKEIQEKYEEIKKNTLKKVKEKFNFSIN